MIYHPIEQTLGGKGNNGSERFHVLEIAHFSTTVNRRVKMTQEEKEFLKVAISKFPNKNHTPVGFNVD